MTISVGIKRDTAPLICSDVYMVRISELYMRSDADIQMYGTYITGYGEIDNDINNRMTTTYTSIGSMVDKWRDGAKVVIVKDSDVVKIYEAITEHLQAWKRILDTSMNVGDAPIEDLIALDSFADELFKYARHKYKTSPVLSGIVAAMANTGRRKTAGYFNKKVWKRSNLTPRKEKVEVTGLPVRTGMNEFLKNQTDILSQRYRN